MCVVVDWLCLIVIIWLCVLLLVGLCIFVAWPVNCFWLDVYIVVGLLVSSLANRVKFC